MNRKHYLEGRTFAKWLVISFAGMVRGRSFWLCKCLEENCKTEKAVRQEHLLSGSSLSCGCRGICRRTHGKTHARIYSIWRAMKKRCYNPKHSHFKYYGGKGIKVCERWRESFKNFYDDMGEPEGLLTIDRIDNNGDYCKENCRWATIKEQNNNKSNNRIFNYQGERLSLEQLAARLGTCHQVIQGRLKRNWTIEKILNTPIRSRSNKRNET